MGLTENFGFSTCCFHQASILFIIRVLDSCWLYILNKLFSIVDKSFWKSVWHTKKPLKEKYVIAGCPESMHGSILLSSFHLRSVLIFTNAFCNSNSFLAFWAHFPKNPESPKSSKISERTKSPGLKIASCNKDPKALRNLLNYFLGFLGSIPKKPGQPKRLEKKAQRIVR